MLDVPLAFNILTLMTTLTDFTTAATCRNERMPFQICGSFVAKTVVVSSPREFVSAVDDKAISSCIAAWSIVGLNALPVFAGYLIFRTVQLPPCQPSAASN